MVSKTIIKSGLDRLSASDEELQVTRDRIAELEKALRAEQSRLRSVSAEQTRSSEKQNELLAQIQKAESVSEFVVCRLVIKLFIGLITRR